MSWYASKSASFEHKKTCLSMGTGSAFKIKTRKISHEHFQQQPQHHLNSPSDGKTWKEQTLVSSRLVSSRLVSSRLLSSPLLSLHSSPFSASLLSSPLVSSPLLSSPLLSPPLPSRLVSSRLLSSPRHSSLLSSPLLCPPLSRLFSHTESRVRRGPGFTWLRPTPHAPPRSTFDSTLDSVRCLCSSLCGDHREQHKPDSSKKLIRRGPFWLF